MSMLFFINTERAYEEIQKNHEEKVWISQPECALDRRHCIVQMLAQAEGRTVIFSVAGKSIRESEKASCHSHVDVYWQ